nr:MAG TPA: hypothetical protein [Caudoviricetes sp.]
MVSTVQVTDIINSHSGSFHKEHISSDKLSPFTLRYRSIAKKYSLGSLHWKQGGESFFELEVIL